MGKSTTFNTHIYNKLAATRFASGPRPGSAASSTCCAPTSPPTRQCHWTPPSPPRWTTTPAWRSTTSRSLGRVSGEFPQINLFFLQRNNWILFNQRLHFRIKNVIDSKKSIIKTGKDGKLFFNFAIVGLCDFLSFQRKSTGFVIKKCGFPQNLWGEIFLD